MKSYIIKRGKHYHKALWRLYFHFGSRFLSYDVIFNTSCWYDTRMIGDHTNKLFGMGFGLNHHKDSIRVGWKPIENSDKIALYAYTYNKGVRFIEVICKISVNMKFNVKIEPHYERNTYIITISDTKQKSIIEYRQNFDFKDNWGFRLFPYFGGNPTAPDDMNISMERVHKNVWHEPTRIIIGAQ